MVPHPPVVVVTGANKGIGFEVCKKLIGNGARVIMSARDEKRLREAAGTIRRYSLFPAQYTIDGLNPGSQLYQRDLLLCGLTVLVRSFVRIVGNLTSSLCSTT